MTIKVATAPKSKSQRSAEMAREPPVRILSPVSRPAVTPVEDDELSGDESLWEGLPQSDQQLDHDMLMGGIEKTVRDTMSEVFASRDGRITTPAAVHVSRRYSDEGIDSPLLTVPPAATTVPRNILSRWLWVEKDTIELIANGEFQIDGLPKLHRTDELRNAYLKKSLKGVYQPLDGGPAEVIMGTTKLQSSFKEPTTFFLAWNIYMSIRTTFEPTRAAGLADWTERLFYFIHLNYPWISILEYIVAYFQLYQDTSPNDWFKPDSTLIAYYLTLSQQKAPTASTSQSHIGTKPKFNTSHKSGSISDEICMMYNRSTGCTWKEKKGEKCPRRHACTVCTSSQHTALMCPEKSTK